MRKKQWVLIEDLKTKIDLILDGGVVTDWRDLGYRLGSAPKTLRWWIQGSANHRPGEIPQESFEAFSDLLAEMLPHLPRVEVSELLLAPAGELRDALNGSRLPEDHAAFLKTAVFGQATLIRRTDELGLVSVASIAEGDERQAISLGEAFRIEFTVRHRCRHALVLQNAGLRWGAVPVATDQDAAIISVPGPLPTGDPDYIYEAEQLGIHRFYCIQTAMRAPAEVRALLAEPLEIDRRVMARIGSFYQATPASDRFCQCFELSVVERHSS
ncbi:MAG: hypothetical protein WDZ83_14355 [Rhizobiaceae bacterium]